MNKNLIRVLSFLMVLILALGLIPLGAMAYNVNIRETYAEKANPKPTDILYYGNNGDPVDKIAVNNTPVTIKTSDYNSMVTYGGKTYQLKGLGIDSEYDFDTEIKTHSSVTIDPFEYTLEWASKWANGLYLVYTAYTPHAHRLSGWAKDPTNHWKYCTVCGEQFIAMNWHHDRDLDDFCDVCGCEIYYYDIELKDFEGGKITIDEDTARFRDPIDIKIEAEEGYQFHKLHIMKIRPNGTKEEVNRKTIVKGESYSMKMPSFPIEVYADFIKK